MSFDRSRKKPHDYQVPAGRQRCEPAFADSDRLMINGERVCPSIATGPVAGPSDPPLVAPPPPAARTDAQRLRVLALPVVCLVVGLTLGIAIGRATAPEALPPALHEAPAATPSTTDGGTAIRGAEHPARNRAASPDGSPDPDPGQPADPPGQ
jgi:hypothetical protein